MKKTILIMVTGLFLGSLCACGIGKNTERDSCCRRGDSDRFGYFGGCISELCAF